MYYVQHYLAWCIAPFIIFCSKRYSPREYFRFPLPWFGFTMFSVYLRYFLTPLSAMSWANLNHTLCGIDNDPWRVYFGMHKYFYFWAEVYLGLTSLVFNTINSFIARMFATDLFYGNRNNKTSS